MNPKAKKWAKFVVRWGIAVFGIAYVVTNLSLRDRVLVLSPDTNLPVQTTLAEADDENSDTYLIYDPVSGEEKRIGRNEVVTRADRKSVVIKTNSGEIETKLLAVLPPASASRSTDAEKLLVEDPKTGNGMWVSPSDVVGGYEVRVPYPRVDVGIRRLLRQADPIYLWAAVLIFPVTFVVTGIRWHLLMRALEIHLSLARAFILNMVGAFYNTFMPGSTGGDVLKAYYAAKFTPLRTRVVMSVIVDRVIGLLALIILGGSMAAYQWENPECRKVAIMCGLVMLGVIVGLIVFYNPLLRKITGLDWILSRLPMQTQVQKAIGAMELYRRRPWLVLGTVILTLPVHITVILSATLAGLAFNLPLTPMYYWVAVPVIVLVGSIPISPQGAGVMEFFAIQLMRPQGATIGQAFVLTMSIRLVQMLWNLSGGVFVARGNYRPPTDTEQATMDDDPPATAPAVA